MSPDERYLALADERPPAPPKGGIYKPVVLTGNQIWVSGHGPMRADKSWVTGKLGADLDTPAGAVAARLVGLGILATLRAELGSLNNVGRVIKLLGMVNATPDFGEQPKVINGCSELFAEIWGDDHGIGARSAVGMGSLPSGIAVEIEAVFEAAPRSEL